MTSNPKVDRPCAREKVIEGGARIINRYDEYIEPSICAVNRLQSFISVEQSSAGDHSKSHHLKCSFAGGSISDTTIFGAAIDCISNRVGGQISVHCQGDMHSGHSIFRVVWNWQCSLLCNQLRDFSLRYEVNSAERPSVVPVSNSRPPYYPQEKGQFFGLYLSSFEEL
jgi:hypothetical protein